ncbi:hypothetical protein D3C85_1433410 [compost metagenome]
MSADSRAIAHVKLCLDQSRQFVADVIVHPVVVRPRLLGGVKIETSTFTQIVSGVVGDIIPARAGVGHHQRNA